MPYTYTDLIRRAYRGDMAHRHVTAISQHHRIQASPGYRAAAGYVAAQLETAGLATVIRRYPADGRARFWTTPSFLEWACEGASLHLLDAQGAPAELLCDFDSIATSLIQRSIPADGEFEVMALPGKGGKDPADYAGLDVAGKVVLTNTAPYHVAELAIRGHGAAGILFDGIGAGGRVELDLPDARQYTSFWWGGAEQPFAWGFVLSPRQGRGLRASLAAGRPVRVRASIRSRLYPGTIEVVDALIPGASDAGEILLVSHLCHPRPSANDNASGAAALLEAAATLARLIAQGALPAPRRGIRCIWVPEMTGTFAWLSTQEAEVRGGRWLAGLNLDMVGADQCQTKGVSEFVSLPAAGASFADHLLNWLGESFGDGVWRKEVAFASGSDHYILSDPSVGIPTPMINDWPDRFYHTSADTPDKVSPAALARTGALAAVYAYWLAGAGPAEAAWLSHLMAARFAASAGREAAATVETLRAASGDAARGRIWADYRRAGAFRAERMDVALGSLSRLGIEPAALAAARARVAGAAAAEESYVRGLLTEEEARCEPSAENAGWRTEAAALIPRRPLPGPIDVDLALQADTPALRPAHRQLHDEAGEALHVGAALLQYWADGRHSVARIAELVALETGQPMGEVALRYFKLLAEAGLVTLQPADVGAPEHPEA